MEKEFVTYEIAVKLKELGFQEDCFKIIEVEDGIERICVDDSYSKYRNNTGDKQLYFKNRFNSGGEYYIAIPLWQQVIDWFREKYKIRICNIVNVHIESIFIVYELYNNQIIENTDFYIAREQAILKAIELIKQK